MRNVWTDISGQLGRLKAVTGRLWRQLTDRWPLWSAKPRPNGSHAHLDQRLVLNLAHKSKLPSWQQFRLLGKFLEPTEKKAVGLLFLVVIAGLLSLGGELILRHRIVAPKVGGEYIEGAVGSISAINPLFSQLNQVDADITHLVYAGLFKYDESLKMIPDLAESYSVDKDGKIFTIKLKKNLQWQDGEPITVDDVAFSIQRFQDPETQSPLWVSFQGVEFNKIDEQTFTLTLPKPFSPFVHLLTTGLLPEHIWQEVEAANMRLSSVNLKPVGAGPYMFASFSKDSRGNIKSYTLKTNPYYQLARPFIQTVTFKFYNDWTSALDALHNRQVKGLSFLPKDQKEKISRPSLKVNSLRVPYYSALFFNVKKNQLLKSLPLKKALALAIDRNQIITNALKGEGVAIGGPILPGQVGFTQNFRTSLNPTGAQELLDGDKWIKISREDFIKKRQQELYQELLDGQKTKDAAAGKKKLTPEETEARKKANADKLAEITKTLEAQLSPTQTVFRHKNNYGLTLKITTLNQPEFVQTATLIKETWQDLGAQVTVELLEADQLKEAIKNRNYEILLYGVLLGADPDPFSFWHSSQVLNPGLNLAGFANRQADTLLEKARATFDPQERAKIYYDFQKILSEELPAVFLYSTTYLYPIDASVRGFNQYRLFQPADRFNGITQWYLLTKTSYK